MTFVYITSFNPNNNPIGQVIPCGILNQKRAVIAGSRTIDDSKEKKVGNNIKKREQEQVFQCGIKRVRFLVSPINHPCVKADLQVHALMTWYTLKRLH